MKILRNIGSSGPLLIIVAAILWALDGVIRRYLYTLPPITIIFFEHFIGLLIILPFIWKRFRSERIGKREFWLLLLVSILSGLLGTLWFTTALLKVHFISFSVVFLLQKLQPLFAIGSASIFLKEKLDKRYIKWALLALVSAYFVTFPNGHVNLGTGEGTVIAALYALGAAFAWGTSTTFSKMILTKVSYKVSTFYRFLITSVIAVFVLFILGYGSSISSAITTSVPFAYFISIPKVFFFIFIALSTGLVALMIYYKGLSKTPVHITTMLELTFPFIAIFIDMTLYKTTLSPSQLISAVILCLAIYKIGKLQSNALTVTTN